MQTTYAPRGAEGASNSNQLRQVLLNLMMNASQAMEGQDKKSLFIETKGGDAGAQVSLRDVGPGIAPEAQARLFEPFFTTKPRGKGTGLGLSVSRSIIEAHRGEIRVESEVGKRSDARSTFGCQPRAPLRPRRQSRFPSRRT